MKRERLTHTAWNGTDIHVEYERIDDEHVRITSWRRRKAGATQYRRDRAEEGRVVRRALLEGGRLSARKREEDDMTNHERDARDRADALRARGQGGHIECEVALTEAHLRHKRSKRPTIRATYADVIEELTARLDTYRERAAPPPSQSARSRENLAPHVPRPLHPEGSVIVTTRLPQPLARRLDAARGDATRSETVRHVLDQHLPQEEA